MERKERLDTLGMSWDPHSTDWDAMFDLLSASPKLLECWPSEAPRGKGKGKGKGREEKERGKGWGRGAAKSKEGKVVRCAPSLIPTTIHHKYPGSIKVATRLDHISHEITSGTSWLSRWTCRIFIMNTRRDLIV